MRIGIYGGTFNPVHHGHLILARQALEEFKLDRLIFVPAAESPFKIQNHTAPPGDRLAMLRLAIAGEDRFSVDPLEIERGGISYSIDCQDVPYPKSRSRTFLPSRRRQC
jgi:nicotinate-nucleotide adenylyltransferase